MTVRERLARRVLRSPAFVEDAVWIAREPDTRNRFGEIVPGAVTETAIRLASAPLDGEEALRLPEGIRPEETLTFWTREAVSNAVESESAGDSIRYDGAEYRIFTVKDWGGFRELQGQREAMP